MNIEHFLQSELEKAARVLAQENSFRHILVSGFDCSTLPGVETDGRKLPEDLVSNFFQPIHQYDASEGGINDFPCLYAFELADAADAGRVLEAFKSINPNEIKRTLPVLKSKNLNSKFLYVGKVLYGVGGRLVTHLGYYHKDYNHGLQLAYWAKELSPPVILNVHVFRFRKDFLPYLESFEVLLAKELQPLIGSH